MSETFMMVPKVSVRAGSPTEHRAITDEGIRQRKASDSRTPLRLSTKLWALGLNSFLCDRLLVFLTDRRPVVDIGL
ncbi:unnamed protein product [Arctogadus glacialis]